MKKQIIWFIIMLLININMVYAIETVKYADCVDGDTIQVFIKGKEVKVRLLAVDAPESVKPDTIPGYYGKEASEYTCKRIKEAKKIELEYDENSDKYDKYDRLLAWVFLDGKLLQTDLVKFGYAKVAYLYDDYKYADTLKKEQERASAKGIGIWNDKERKKYEGNASTPNDEVEKNEDYEIAIITFVLLLLVFAFSKFKQHK